MSAFFERVRAALATKGYDVLRELGSGGMGIVVLAHERKLDRLVAAKVIRPEMHTAVAVERFREESRILAKLSHRHIVPVYDADEAVGLPYYTMQFLEGETVADRLIRGPMPRAEVRKMGRDLMDALECAHLHGVIHRDVKPSNVFWDGKDAVLTDFGIAKRMSRGEEHTDTKDLTEPGVKPGTRRYMSPEQLSGTEATPLTDLYAAALVVYEAYTARHWLDAQYSRWRAWRRVPWLEAWVLWRALAWEPERRWRDAATFRHRFWAMLHVRYRLRAVGLTAGGLVAGAAFVWFLMGRIISEQFPFHRPGALQVTVLPFGDVCLPGGMSGDRVARELVRNMQGYVDFSVRGPVGRPLFVKRSTVIVAGSVCARGNSVRAEVNVRTGAGEADPGIVAVGDSGRIDLLADTLAYGIVLEIWKRENALDPVLPVNALPRTPGGLAAWLRAERLMAQARWGEADRAYDVAEQIDSTCWLCPWRHALVDKWLGRPYDRARAARYLSHIRSFPPHYQAMIRASVRRFPQSIDSLRVLTQQRPGFLPALFMLADETYHRGPLIGRPLEEGVESFESFVRLRPDFLPAWEHLTWALAAAGKETGAKGAYRRLDESGPPRDPFSQEVRALLYVGLACRFDGSAACEHALDVALGGIGAGQYPDLGAGPRYLMSFDAPGGAVRFGRRFAARDDAPALAKSGLVGQLSGFLALGQVDSARAAARALHGFQRAELDVLSAELDGALLLLDPDSADGAVQWAATQRALDTHTRSGASSSASRRRAAWMLLLLARRWGGVVDSDAYVRKVAGEQGRRPLATLLRADAEALHARTEPALSMTDSLTWLQADSLGDPEGVDPFFRTVLHLFRAAWYERLHDADGAERELHWYENNDVWGRPSGPPQVGDMDWAFGTLARWRLATLLDAARDRRVCTSYARVAAAWANGDTRYRARADSAGGRLVALGCKERG